MENTQTNSVTTEVAPVTKTLPSCVPPKIFKRNEFGLLEDPSVKYVFNEDGTVNWRKMVKPEFLKPNKEYFTRRNKPVPESIEGLEDHELIILLGGLKELAQVRGYSCVSHCVNSPTPDYVVSVCSIDWIPNYETEGRSVCYSAIGDASPNNTSGFGRNYLGAFAENRAFVRAVRNYLKINIVSQEEIGGSNNEPVEEAAPNLLKEVMEKYGVSFEAVKQKLVTEGLADAANYNSINDIPRYKQFEIAERIKKKAAERQK